MIHCSGVIYFVCMRMLNPSFLADGFVCLIHGLEFLLRRFLHILAKSGDLVRVVFDSHLAISFLHLLVGSAWLNLQDAVVAVVVWTELCEDGIHLCL